MNTGTIVASTMAYDMVTKGIAGDAKYTSVKRNGRFLQVMDTTVMKSIGQDVCSTKCLRYSHQLLYTIGVGTRGIPPPPSPHIRKEGRAPP